MYKIKILLLSMTVAIFAISSVVSSLRHHHVTELITGSMKAVNWAVSELDRELYQFMHSLQLVALDFEGAADVQLRFDILWSRIDVLAVGEENRMFRERHGAVELLENLKHELERFEPEVFALTGGDPAAERLMREFAPIQKQVREFYVNNFSIKSTRDNLTRIFDAHTGEDYYLYGLLLSGAMLILLVIRESRINRRQAFRDPLTGLPNRACFNGCLQDAIMSLEPGKNQQMALYTLDLDNFKGVNDYLGHGAGDIFLKEVARRLSELPARCKVARLGGDEFVILQPAVQGRGECLQLIERIKQQFDDEIEVDGHRQLAQMSIGISLYPQDAAEAEQLMSHADTAMYTAKKTRGTSYCFFEPYMNEKAIRQRVLTDALSQALMRGEVRQVYQPIVCLQTRDIKLVESLVRWHHDIYGDISPAEVIDIAEKSGLAQTLNEWALEQACQQNVRWRQAGLPAIRVAVNISPTMYSHCDLAEIVQRLLTKTGMSANDLVLEVTEDTASHDIENSANVLPKLREMGVELALDDFGTGYSSLSHLQEMPFQILKIDKSFIWKIHQSGYDIRFIRAIITLAKGLGMRVVAEGIEQQAQYAEMFAEGCDYGQGFLFSRPVSGEEMVVKLSHMQQQRVGSSSLSASERLAETLPTSV